MFGRRYLFGVTLAAFVAAAACSGESSDPPTEPTPPPPTGPSTLQITNLVDGTGAEAANGNTAFVAYAVWHYDPAGADSKGQQIEANTFSYVIGSNQVIAGLSQGTVGMKVGGRRRLIIPPSLAYGSTGNGPIRPNEWIVFEFELLAVA